MSDSLNEKDDTGYRYVIGKVSKTDKNGEDISGDILGPGGARRDDGTLSAMVKELSEIDPEMLKRLREPSPIVPPRQISSKEQKARQKELENQRRKEQFKAQMAGVGRQMTDRALHSVIDPLFDRFELWVRDDFIPMVGEKWKTNVKPKIRSGWDSLVHSGQKKTKASQVIKEPVQESKVLVEADTRLHRFTPDGTRYEISSVFNEYQKDIDNEELQKKLFQITYLALLLARELRDLPPDIQIAWKDSFQQLSSQQTTDILNKVLKDNPSLLEVQEVIDLYRFLEYGKLLEGQFIPIHHSVLVDNLRVEGKL